MFLWAALPWPFVLAEVGCHKSAETEVASIDAPEPAALETAPSTPTVVISTDTPADDMVRALSALDGEPACSAVEALSPTPVASLLQIVATVQMPPTVPMRAASCLVRGHGAEIESEMLDWVSNERTLGLALLVMGDLDALPPDLGKRLAERSLAGPHAERLRPKIAESANPDIKALLGP